MEDCNVKCTFDRVSSNTIKLINSSIGIPTKANKDKTELSCACSLSKANEIRSIFANTIAPNSATWFSITYPKKKNLPFFPFGKNIGNEIHVSFGSLLSTSKFIVHDTPLNDATQWTVNIPNGETLLIQCQVKNKTNSSIHLTFPMKCIDKTILVIDGDNYCDIILNINAITADVQENDTIKNNRLYGNNPIIESLNRCSDILIRISSKSDADQFLDYLHTKYGSQIFYTRILIEHNSCKSWDKIEFNWYQTNESLYAMSMLHSLGYLFDDKYLMNQSFQGIMVELAERDEKCFYQLALNAFYELKRCHWLDLTTIFNQIPTKINQDESHRVGVINLTPTRLYIMPKERTKGHRAMRYKSFSDEDNFCLVNLKPDPSDEYLTSDKNALEYFQNIFETGIELGRNRYHLFGSSNSQLKDHSFWFIKASSLEDIDQKRLQLGRFNEITNLGTYVARLGLWFSTSSPTNIQLNYCQTLKEFNQRVQQKEMCVMMIDDIKRNGYCFTDGNGFISKGLAETLSMSPNNNFPSAYQIRMAGCKGLLVIDPESNFDQFYIKIRPSMEKFKCDDWTLDICEYSRPIPTRLNNQIILLLSDLGVPNETFLRLQKQWFDKNPSQTTYSKNLLDNKIPLPNNECRYMYGCAFESKLKAGTCFIRYEVLNEYGKSMTPQQFKCVEGRVIVTKNPCPYAGDMVELTAVDIPELHCLSDVIVFSTEDNRPDFNKIAGSDLDGDQYFVYWGEEFSLQRSVDPLPYVGDDKITHPTTITPTDVIRYCLSTIGATSYGEIYNLHATIVDRNDENHPQRTCQTLAIELAGMFASAIDSGKTGYVINKERVKEIREKYGQRYPDFLMKYGKAFYESQSIVGILYRNAVLYKKGDIGKLNNAFAKLGLDDNRLQNPGKKKATSRSYSAKKSTQ